MARDDTALVSRLLTTPLDELMAEARTRRGSRFGNYTPARMTYSPKVFIPLTRLCADVCHYCTFATTPSRLEAPYLSEDEVLQIARAGVAAGCKEALFTLGDAPERRYAAAREWLAEEGSAARSTTCGTARSECCSRRGFCLTLTPVCWRRRIGECCARSPLRSG
ncbi:hypothetical protein ACFSHP_12970 [Novosphingobium panipatense]